MDSFGLIIALAAVFVLVHLLVMGYLYRKGNATDGPSMEETLGDGSAGSEASRESDAELSETGAAEPAEEIRCSTCGSPNDPSYQFCRQCVSELGPQPPMGGPGAEAGRPET